MHCVCLRPDPFTAPLRRDTLNPSLSLGKSLPMRLIFRSILWLLLVLPWQPALADDLTDKQPSYTRIAVKCGEDPSRPSFSSADYAKAMADAAKALKTSKKEGTSVRTTAIQNSVARLKECMEEETRKFTKPRDGDCADFLIDYNAFLVRSEDLIRTGKRTAEDRKNGKEMFRAPAMKCVRDLMDHCIDPTDTRSVDFVIAVMEAASNFKFILSYGRKTGLERSMITMDPSKPKMSFCTDTDYACKHDPVACNNRIVKIKAIMQTYLDE